MHEIIYRPFKNTVDDLGTFVYKSDVEHALLLVEDSPGKIHFELKCHGPLRVRCSYDRIYTSSPNDPPGLTIHTMDCSAQHLEELQDRMIEAWKRDRQYHFERHQDSVRNLKGYR